MQTSRFSLVLWRVFLLSIALVIGLVVAELVVAKLIEYPSYGVEAKVRYRIGGEYWTNIRKPYAKVYNVEGKNIAKYNNYGLPGTDVTSLENPVVVLGSSFVEALQYQPEEIASSVFASELVTNGNDNSVINLGCSWHDPYDSWFRLLYFREKLGFTPRDVILVLNSDNKDWFARHPQPFAFTKSADFGVKNSSLKFKIMLTLRNSSSLIELLAKGMKGGNGQLNEESEAVAVNKNNSDTRKMELEQAGEGLSAQMVSCLAAFNGEYPGFRVLSVYDNVSFNRALQEYCDGESIPLSIVPMAKPEFMINGAGHFNLNGNRYLGKQLYALFTKQDSPQDRKER